MPGVTVWDLHRDACNLVCLGHDKAARSCMWSTNGALMVAGFINGTTRIWETNTFHQLHPDVTWHGDLLALSPDGCWVVTGVSDGCRLWNVASGRLQWALRCHGDQINAAAFDPKSARVITRSPGDCMIRVWAVETGEELLVLREPTEEALSWVRHEVAYSPDGRLVLSWPSSASGGAAKIWEASSGVLRAHLNTPGKAALSACFSPCSRYVASASEEGVAYLWRTSDGSCTAKASENGCKVDHVAISPDGEVLCCGATDGTVFFRDLTALRSLVPLDECKMEC